MSAGTRDAKPRPRPACVPHPPSAGVCARRHHTQRDAGGRVTTILPPHNTTHDEDQLDEEADEPHDHEAEGGLGGDLVEL